MRFLSALLAVLLLYGPTLARDNGQWEDQPPEIRQWFQQLMQPDNPNVSCCGEADAFGADSYAVEGDHYIAIITDGKGIIPEGTRIPIPNTKYQDEMGSGQSDWPWHRVHWCGRSSLLLRGTRRGLR